MTKKIRIATVSIAVGLCAYLPFTSAASADTAPADPIVVVAPDQPSSWQGSDLAFSGDDLGRPASPDSYSKGAVVTINSPDSYSKG